MKSRSQRLREILEAIPGKQFLVLGDLYLDRYVFGEPTRISREAPVLVLEERSLEHRPGGGAAPSLALAALGARVHQLGVVGEDPEGALLCTLLRERGVETSYIVVDPTRPTTVKTRIVAVGAYNVLPQQLVRIDRQVRDALQSDIEAQLIAAVRTWAPQSDAVLLSDYRSGTLTPALIAATLTTGRSTVVDSQGRLDSFAGATVLKCNRAEAEQFLGVTLDCPEERARHLVRLRQQVDCTILVVTLGGEGAALVSANGYAEFAPPMTRMVFDVTGAGDTVLALLGAALAVGSAPEEALALAQVAASIVIGKFGNAQASYEELHMALNQLS